MKKILILLLITFLGVSIVHSQLVINGKRNIVGNSGSAGTALNTTDVPALPTTGGIDGSGSGIINFASPSTLTGATVHNLDAAKICLDSSGSGTAQVCSTTPTFSPAAGDTIIYKTTTTNTGDVTLNVNSSSAIHIRKWQGTSTLSSGDLVASVYVNLTYDGTYWEIFTIGNAPTGSVSVVGGGNLTSTALITGGGSQTLQTPSATSTLSSGGALAIATSISTGTAPGGTAGSGSGSIFQGEGTVGSGASGVDGIVGDSTGHCSHGLWNNIDVGCLLAAGQAAKITNYNSIATIDNGVPSELGHSDLTAQTSALTTTALMTPAATGMFRVSYYAKVTTIGTTSILGGTTGFVLNYTDGTDSVAQTLTLTESNQSGTVLSIGTGNITNTTAAVVYGTTMVYAKTGIAMTYNFGYTSTGTAMQFEIHVKVEAL